MILHFSVLPESVTLHFHRAFVLQWHNADKRRDLTFRFCAETIECYLSLCLAERVLFHICTTLTENVIEFILDLHSADRKGYSIFAQGFMRMLTGICAAHAVCYFIFAQPT